MRRAANKTFSYPDTSGSCFSSFWALFDAANLGVSDLNATLNFSQLGLNSHVWSILMEFQCTKICAFVYKQSALIFFF